MAQPPNDRAERNKIGGQRLECDDAAATAHDVREANRLGADVRPDLNDQVTGPTERQCDRPIAPFAVTADRKRVRVEVGGATAERRTRLRPDREAVTITFAKLIGIQELAHLPGAQRLHVTAQ